jgi:hypothetical protein
MLQCRYAESDDAEQFVISKVADGAAAESERSPQSHLTIEERFSLGSCEAALVLEPPHFRISEHRHKRFEITRRETAHSESLRLCIAQWCRDRTMEVGHRAM